jgi:hypothetical protein
MLLEWFASQVNISGSNLAGQAERVIIGSLRKGP